MAGTLTIDRSNLPGSPTDLIIGDDESTGFTLAPGLSLGVILWRKNHAEDQPNVPGRIMTDYTRETTSVAGGINCFGSDPEDLQDRIEEAIAALTQIHPTNGFQPFTMTYQHTDGAATATYQFKCTEPGDVTPGNAPDGTLDDAQLASLIQTVGFTVARNPIPISGPI